MDGDFGLELNNPPAHSDGDCLRAIAGAELFHDVFDMHLYSLFSNEQLVRDIPVTISAGNLGENFDFASGECFVTIMFSQMGRDLRWNTLLPTVDLADRIDHILRRHALEHVGARSSFESTLNFNIALKRRQNDDSGLGKLRSDRDHRVNPADAGKSEVHESHVGLVLAKLLDRLVGVAGFSNHMHVRLIINDSADSLAQ